MTPACFQAYVKGYLEEQQLKSEIRNRQNYSLACMVRAAIGAKHMPDFERFYPEKKRAGTRKTQMTDRQMYQQVLALNAAMGGTVDGE